MQDGQARLWAAAAEGHSEVVRLLLDKGDNKEAASAVSAVRLTH